MSRIRTRTLVAVVISLATVAITALAGTAQAAPKQFGPSTYDASWNATSLTLTLHNASASTDNGKLTIRDRAGAELFRMPLAYRNEYRQFPIDARQAGNKITLIPSRNIARSVQVNPTEVENVRGIARHQVAAPADPPGAGRPGTRPFPAAAQCGNDRLFAGRHDHRRDRRRDDRLHLRDHGRRRGLSRRSRPPGRPRSAVFVGLVLGGGGTLIGTAIQYFNTINSPFTPPRK